MDTEAAEEFIFVFFFSFDKGTPPLEMLYLFRIPRKLNEGREFEFETYSSLVIRRRNGMELVTTTDLLIAE